MMFLVFHYIFHIFFYVTPLDLLRFISSHFPSLVICMYCTVITTRISSIIYFKFSYTSQAAKTLERHTDTPTRNYFFFSCLAKFF